MGRAEKHTQWSLSWLAIILDSHSLIPDHHTLPRMNLLDSKITSPGWPFPHSKPLCSTYRDGHVKWVLTVWQMMNNNKPTWKVYKGSFSCKM